MNALVTVLMSVYNTRESWLRMAIESILQQTYTNIEFLIIIDCPTDNSGSIIEEYAKKDNRIVVEYNDINLGLTNSLNKGISMAKGKYIARMDSDDISFADRIEKQIQYFEQHDLDILGARMIKIDEMGEPISAPSSTYSEEQVKKVLRYMDIVPHPTWIVKTDIYKKLNGYREIKCCEDYDFLLRAQCHGFKIGMYDEVVLKYRINLSGITRSNSLRQFLTARYLQQNIKHIDDISQSNVEEYLSGKIDENEAKKFDESAYYFRKSSTLFKDRHFLHSGWQIIKGLAKSRYAFANLKDIISVQRIMSDR